MHFRIKVLLLLAIFPCSLGIMSIPLIGLLIVYPSHVLEVGTDERNEDNANKSFFKSNFDVFGKRHSDSGEEVEYSSFLPVDSIIGNISNTSPAPGQLQIPYVGIETEGLTPELARALNLHPASRGEIVTSIAPGGPGEKAGFRAMNYTQISDSDEVMYTSVGDIILTVDGGTSFTTNFDSLQEYVYANKRVGENMIVAVLRDGQIKDVKLTVSAQPEFLWYVSGEKGFKIKYPSDWEPVTSSVDNYSNTTEGKVVEFKPMENNGSTDISMASVAVKLYPAGREATINSGEANNSMNIRLLNSNATTLDNIHAYITIFNDYSKNYPMKVLTVFAVKENQLHRIDYSGDLSSYDFYLPVALEMISSFRFS